jgi:hypothetical protein
MYNMVLYLYVLIVFSLRRESLKLILATDPPSEVVLSLPWSRPMVERAAKRCHQLAEVKVDRAVTPPERRHQLGRGRVLPSRAASLAATTWREEDSHRLSTLTASPCPCASVGRGGEL